MDSQFAKSDGERNRALVDERSSSGDELLHLPVCVDGTELGRPTDLLVDLDRLRVVGLNVRASRGGGFLRWRRPSSQASRSTPPRALRYWTRVRTTAGTVPRCARCEDERHLAGAWSDSQRHRPALRRRGDRIVVKGESGNLRSWCQALRIGQRKAPKDDDPFRPADTSALAPDVR